MAMPSTSEQQTTAFQTPVVGREAVEEALLVLWRRILVTEQIGREDNFFELGGESLEAVELITEIERLFAVKLAAGALLEKPTIAKLSSLIEPQIYTVKAPLLVTMRASGRRAPLFIVAPDHLFHYLHLLKQIDPAYPVFGLQPPYSDGFRQVGITIEQMAEMYLAEMKSICPEGECHIVGFCAGGVVAFEIAQRLTAEGWRVGLLALLDTPCPPARTRHSVRKLQYIKFRMMSHMRRFGQLSPREMIQYVSTRARVVREMAMRKLGRSSQPAIAPETLNTIANRFAIFHYGVVPYPGVIDLCNAQERDPLLGQDTRLSWKQFSSDVRVHTFAGRHGMFLRPPAVFELGVRLNERLADAEKRLKQQKEASPSDTTKKNPRSSLR